MPVRNRRLNKFINRGHEKSQEPQALKASPWGDPHSSMPGKSLGTVLEKVIFVMPVSQTEDQIMFILLHLNNQ